MHSRRSGRLTLSCTSWTWSKSSWTPVRSTKSLDRPGLQRALGMLKAGDAEALLVVKLDRLTRSVVDLGTLVERYFAPGKAALRGAGRRCRSRPREAVPPARAAGSRPVIPRPGPQAPRQEGSLAVNSLHRNSCRS